MEEKEEETGFVNQMVSNFFRENFCSDQKFCFPGFADI